MMEKVFLVVFCLVPMISAQAEDTGDTPKWDVLRVTYGRNQTVAGRFDNLPRTETAAQAADWTSIDNDCEGTFLGKRYMLGDDPSVILLFDRNGFIAGIQCGFPASKKTDVYPPQSQIGQMFQEDDGRYTLTAYFIDPATICSTGRTQKEFDSQGTGNALYFQTGSNPLADNFQVAKEEDNIDTAKWTKGKCYRQIGLHYFPKFDDNEPCENFEPAFVLYVKGKLYAFGWSVWMEMDSTRFHNFNMSKFPEERFQEMRCLHKYPTVAGLHVYMIGDPSKHTCPDPKKQQASSQK